jgi:hypothetical protein
MYEQYLKNLLEPLRVYDLSNASLGGAELYAAGTGLDTLEQQLEIAEREALVATAEGAGLDRTEALFARKPAAVTTEQRRLAIAALLQIDGDSLTPETIDRTIRGCGIRARAIEVDTGHLRVIFPEVAGVPEEFEQIQKIILDILPCHLAVEFYFRYLTWLECEQAEMAWVDIEAAEHTWKSFELAIPPEA